MALAAAIARDGWGARLLARLVAPPATIHDRASYDAGRQAYDALVPRHGSPLSRTTPDWLRGWDEAESSFMSQI